MDIFSRARLGGSNTWYKVLAGRIFVSGIDDFLLFLSRTNRLPIENSGYNTITGMDEGGEGSRLRHIYTPFGSKVDRVRVLAEQLGFTHNQFIRSKVFKEALKAAEFKKVLSEGSFGVTELWETNLLGENIKLVRKRIKEEAYELVEKSANKEYYKRGLDIRNEAYALKKLGHTETVPSFYGIRDKSLWMEYMPGESLYRYSLKHPKFLVSEGIRSKLQSVISEAAQLGIENLDLHSGNILWDPVSERISNIDWGLAVRGKAGIKRSLEIYHNMMHKLNKVVGIKQALGEVGSVVKASTSLDLGIAETLLANQVPRSQQLSVPMKRGARGWIEHKNIEANKSANDVRGIYNYKEAMPEKGMAKAGRSTNTDFGSMWRGLGKISTKIAEGLSSIKKLFIKKDDLSLVLKYLATGVKEDTEYLMNPRVAFEISKGKTPIEFARLLGIKDEEILLGNMKEIGRSVKIGNTDLYEHTMRLGGAGFTVTKKGRQFIHIDPEVARDIFSRAVRGNKRFLKKAGNIVRDDNFLKAVVYHEYLERGVFRRFSNLPNRSMSYTHYASQVLLGEGGFIRATGSRELKELFTAVRASRPEELKVFNIGFDAFRHEGIAARYRKVLSDFRSPWRGLIKGNSIKIARDNVQRGKELKYLASLDLKKTQRALTEWSVNGGRRHTRYGGRAVESLSRYGGD